MAKDQKRNTLYTLLGKIGDILLIPIVILAFFTSIMIFNQQKTNTVPMVFGVGMVRILSSSMSDYCVEAGRNFEIGERVFINKTNQIKVGDIIAFYDYSDTVDKYSKFDLTGLETKSVKCYDKKGNLIKDSNGDIVYTTSEYVPVRDENDNVIFNQEFFELMNKANIGEQFEYNSFNYTKKPVPENRTSLNELKDKKIVIKFHQVIQIKIDESGTIFYVTKGTHNSAKDPNSVRADYVVGKFAGTPKWVSSTLGWMASSVGMICCVCIPLGILCILETLSLIEQVNFMMIERRLLAGTAYWQDKEVQRLLKTDEMEKVVRIIYYIKAPKEDREDLKDELWFSKGNLTKKEQREMQKVVQSWEILETKGKREYLLFWKNNLKSKWDLKHIDSELNDLTFNEVLKK